jgi:hypothetical protein
MTIIEHSKMNGKEALPEFVKAINAVIRKYCPDSDVSERDIEGLIILQFPKEHEESGLIHNTFLGKLCFAHAIECILEVQKESIQNKNPLAS